MKIAFAVMVAVLVLAPLPPFQVYPGVPDEGAVLRAVRLRLQPAHRLWRPVVVRPCDVLRLGSLRLGPYCQGRHGEPAVLDGAWNWLSIPLPAQSPALAIFGGTLVAGILGVIVGGIAIRRQGIYFAMITLALAQMLYFFALQAKFTGGEDGIQGVPRGKLFGFIDLSDTMTMYVVVVVIFLAAFLVIYRIVHSPFGEVLKAIRENEPRAISLGYKTERYKLVAFVLSAVFAGLAGATKALVFQLASLTDVHWTMSGEVVLMTLVGGLGTIFGPVVGATIIVAMQTYFASFGEWVPVIQGAIFVVCVLAFRRGVVGELAARLHIKL